MKDALYEYLLLLGDQSMIMGHRLSELCGHGPTLETDMAFTNISLDLFGEVRNYYQHAASLSSKEETEDTIAFLRSERQYYNPVLVEQPNTDFAHVVVRQYLFDVHHANLLEQLTHCKDDKLASIAIKSLKEAKYHLRFSSNWLRRLALGTEESRKRVTSAIDYLYPFAHELYTPSSIESAISEQGLGVDYTILEKDYKGITASLFGELNIDLSVLHPRIAKGKEGRHSEFLGHILSDLQYMQRAYPNMSW